MERKRGDPSAVSTVQNQTPWCIPRGRSVESNSPWGRGSRRRPTAPQARAELDAYFREKLQVPIISELEDSLWRGVYLYGTDNHLSTEGVQIHTQRLIPLLRAQMEQDGLLEKE